MAVFAVALGFGDRGDGKCKCNDSGKCKGKCKGNFVVALRFTPAFGRVEGLRRLLFT